jgi:hypothetical protein
MNAKSDRLIDKQDVARTVHQASLFGLASGLYEWPTSIYQMTSGLVLSADHSPYLSHTSP